MSTRDAMLALRLEGRTYQEIGNRFDVSRQRAQQMLRPPADLREAVVKRADGRCSECGIIVGKAGDVHHKRSIGFDLYDGGYNDIANLELMCVSCHRSRHPGLLTRNPYLWKAGEGPKPTNGSLERWNQEQAILNGLVNGKGL